MGMSAEGECQEIWLEHFKCIFCVNQGGPWRISFALVTMALRGIDFCIFSFLHYATPRRAVAAQIPGKKQKGMKLLLEWKASEHKVWRLEKPNKGSRKRG